MTSPDMTQIYTRIRRRARQLVSRLPVPDFYKDLPLANQFSRQFFDTDPVVRQMRRFVEENLEDDFGHGLAHAVRVSLDAGALMLAECRQAGFCHNFTSRRVRMILCAGLLHDIRRREKDHALAGAEVAREILKCYPFSREEIGDICQAIANHEAFRDAIPIHTPEGLLVSDCLYDADKFRWGTDNFKYTVWNMVSCTQVPLARFMENYPRAMASIARIRETFRSGTGKIYGPRFIDMGLAVGEELHGIILNEFGHLI